MILALNLFILGINIFQCINAAPAASEIKNEADVKSYLDRFGYYDRFSPSASLKDSLERLQTFAGLKVTGQLDVATIKQISTPRCGLSDPKISVKKNRRSRRFVLQGSTWTKNLLTWKLVGRGRTLDRETIRRVMYKAFAIWNSKTNMAFREISSGTPDIWVRFETYSHGDPYSFDGQGGTLAHAFYPHNNKGLSGDVHFDDSEEYTYQSPNGRNLLWVATHELGHSLGLDHSNVRAAVMFPWYTKYKPGFDLNYDDVVAIQSLYGSKTTQRTTTKRPTTIKTTTTTTTTTPTTTTTTKRTTTRQPPTKISPTSYSRTCPTSPIILHYYNRYAKMEVVVTANQKMYFIVKKKGIKYGPLSTKSYLPASRVLDDVTAAMSTPDQKNTIFFAGENYYVYLHFRFISGPHRLHDNSGPLGIAFPSWVRQIDAAMTWHRNKRTYFFSGKHYWRYDNVNKRMDKGYPKYISSGWRGLPSTVDSAYSSNTDKVTYFTKGDQIYKLDDFYVRVAQDYPKHVGENFLQCGGLKWTKAGSIAVGGIVDINTFKRGNDP